MGNVDLYEAILMICAVCAAIVSMGVGFGLAEVAPVAFKKWREGKSERGGEIIKVISLVFWGDAFAFRHSDKLVEVRKSKKFLLQSSVYVFVLSCIEQDKGVSKYLAYRDMLKEVEKTLRIKRVDHGK